MIRRSPICNNLFRASKIIATATAGATGTQKGFTYTSVPIKKLDLPSLRLPKHHYGVNGIRMPHMMYDTKHLETIEITHRVPANIRDRLALFILNLTRKSFDIVTRYHDDRMTKPKWVNRGIIVESVAAVPGMVAGTVRHLRSLRKFRRDSGWIHHLLEEAENERMHLFFFLTEKKPSVLFRFTAHVIQYFFLVVDLLLYFISPKMTHRFTGYLEEEAIHTYTTMLKDIDIQNGPLAEWKTKPAPKEFIDYYNLRDDATYRDVILCIRADEVGHREFNHFFSDIHGKTVEPNYEELLAKTGEVKPAAAADSEKK